MKASGFVVLAARRNSRGVATKLVIERVTQRYPATHSGDIVAKLELDVDDSLLAPTVLEGKVPPGAATITLEVPERSDGQ